MGGMHVNAKRLALALVGSSIAALLLLPLSLGGLHYFGYCSQERRYLSEEELKIAAIKDTLVKYPRTVRAASDKPSDGSRYVIEDRGAQSATIPYKNVEEFVQRNAGCCSIVRTGREGFAPTLWQRLMGALSTVMKVEHRIDFEDQRGVVDSAIAERYVGLSSSGQVRDTMPSLWRRE
ncbi:MAG: hypothetical protein M3O62_06630 [Pseudomonadota bacterium]|nr:hypothetical protein [Pseudomonadota bacterium]